MSVAGNASGSSVRMVTNMGDIDVELFDTVAPITVANFLKYINDGDLGIKPERPNKPVGQNT